MEIANRSNAPEASVPACPSQAALQLLSGKWSSLVVRALRDGPVRTNELRRRLGGISQKVLAQTLRELEASGLVVRTVHDTVPPHVDYTLTTLGVSLSGALVPLDQWVQEHRHALAAAAERAFAAPSSSAPG